MLAERGHRARGLIRNPDHARRPRRPSAPSRCSCDIEARDDIAPAAVDGADAVVFAAGAGPGSGPERKRTVDYGGAVKLIDAARPRASRRYAMVSAISAGRP